MLGVLIGVAIATLLLWLWTYMKKTYSYWDERGIPYKKPMLFFGNSWPIVARRTSIAQLHSDIYKLFPDVPYYGFYDFMKPFLVVKDLELVERVLIKDFHHFVDHGFGSIDENTNPIDINLFSMTGKKWRAMRNKFSPMFTTGKLRQMVPQMKDLSDSLVNALEKSHTEVDLRDMFQRYSMDVIASCAFGINVNAIEEKEESEFRRMGKLAFKMTPMQMVRFFLHASFPKFAKWARVPQNNPVVSRYFSKVLKETLNHRKNTKLTRTDFVQLFVTLQQKGSIEFEGDDVEDEYLKTDATEKNEKKIENYELTDDVMVGQAFVFMVAGFEATAIAMMYLCYELSLNPGVQAKAREEVVRAVKNRGGVLDYDTLKEMPYFNQCVLEMLRMHTFVGALFRVCTKDYTFPGTSLSIKAGQSILIPATGIHEDPAHYEEPEKFNPDRFAPDVTRPNCSFLPFGDGPRVCIGKNLPTMETAIIKRQPKATQAQVDHMVDYLVINSHVAVGKFKGKTKGSSAKLKGSWEDLAKELNSMYHGKAKDVKSWKSTWRDNKSAVAAKVAKLKKLKGKTGALPQNLVLTERDKKICDIVGLKYMEGDANVPDSFPEEHKEAAEELTDGIEEFTVPVPISALSTNGGRGDRPGTHVSEARTACQDIAERQVSCMEMFAEAMRSLAGASEEQTRILERMADQQETTNIILQMLVDKHNKQN